MVLFLGAVRRGEFESLLRRGIPCGALIDENTRLKLGDLSSFRVVDRFDFTRPKPELSSRIKEIRDRYGMGCLINVIEQYVAHFAYAAQELGLRAVSPAAAELCIDKYAMKRRFAERIGPDCVPRFMKIDSDADRHRFGQAVPFPHIWKPINLTSSLFVTICDDEGIEARTYRSLLEQLPGYYVKSGQTDKPFGIMVEEFAEGSNHSIDCLIDAAGNIASTPVVDVLTGRDIGVGDFHHFARIAPSDLSEREQRELTELAVESVRALDLRAGVAHVELVGNKLLEVGARPGGNRVRILEMAFGIDYMFAYHRILTGAAPDLRRRHAKPTALVTPYPVETGSLVAIRRLDRLEKLPGCSYHEVRAKIGQTVGLSRDGFKSPLYIEVQASRPEDIRKAVAEIASWDDLFEVRRDGR
jgi:biotin carboxylase